ncbi:hypothetical protein [Phenylobacterium kunshanense]|uniref:Uncharacterized protein n=1 Tax=Phenylobacterium kunshanense TaxID=1445034 RepID=A0A328BQC5_9CAUL|nr:hypothetical protein [Phenylobacterium kunshanense]RAK68799.1 hypothetical protein DJ019_01950 [Phenylobacterium kunshanense]
MTADPGFINPPWPMDWSVTLCLGHDEDAPALAYNIELGPAPRTQAEEREDPMDERRPCRVRGQMIPGMPDVSAGDQVALSIRYPGPVVDRFQATILAATVAGPNAWPVERTLDFLVTSPIYRRL